jgi:hypothetical protein
MHRAVLVPTALLALAASGCLWKNKLSDESSRVALSATGGDGDIPNGARLHGSVGMAGLYIGAEAEVRDLELAPLPPSDEVMPPPPGQDYTGLGVNILLRASPLGILGREHELERWLDFGVEAGAGAGTVVWDASSSDGIGNHKHTFVGGWVELGTFTVGKRYVALVGDIRYHDERGPWRDEIVAGIGLAWTRRGLAGPLDLRD